MTAFFLFFVNVSTCSGKKRRYDDNGYSKPSVSHAMGLLKDEGLIKKDSDGFIKLTEAGTILAKRIYERHTVLTRLLMNIGVDEKTASEDACRIEHYISDTTFNAIKAHMREHGIKPITEPAP